MTSIKINFRPSTIPDHQGFIYYRIIHERKVSTIKTSYRIYLHEWDRNRSLIIRSADDEREMELASIRYHIRFDIDRLSNIIRKLGFSGIPFTVGDIASGYAEYVAENSLFTYMKKKILELRQTGRFRTSETYTAALNSFRKFRKSSDIILDEITPGLIRDYEIWLTDQGLTPNTISFYMRILRAVYNRAVDDEIIDDRKPFRKVYTGIAKTIKRALPLTTIRKISTIDLSGSHSLEYARDIFIMSFMLRGMSFIDMAYLRKTDLRNGYISYRRRKTGRHLTIKWTVEMQQILDRYEENKTKYLLPIIRKEGINERAVARNTAYNINKSLKIIAARLGLQIPLTLYVARHSWASTAKTKGIPLSIISEGLGHTSESTTRIYLSTLDTAAVDRANALLLRALTSTSAFPITEHSEDL